MRRLLRGSIKLSVIAGVVAGMVVIGRKLMGGLGPEPGSEAAPKEWPSLVPDPPAAGGNGAGSTSGNGASTTASTTGSAEGSSKIDWTAPSKD